MISMTKYLYKQNLMDLIRLSFKKKNVNLIQAVSIKKFIHSSSVSTCRSKGSELFVTGDRAQIVFGVLSPYLNISEALNNPYELECNIKRRNLNHDVHTLLKQWDKLKQLKSNKCYLEEEKATIAKTMRKFSKEKSDNKNNIDRWKIRGREIRDQLKSVTKEFIETEECLVDSFLHLPNKLDDSVADEDKVLISLFNEPVFENFSPKSHQELGKLNKEIEFLDCSPTAYYLKSKLALLELACADYFTSIFKNQDYLFHSNPDFAKGVVVEGSGIHISDIEKVFMLSSHKSDNNQNSQYLVGGGSLQAFVSYFTKQIIENPNECLPQKFITISRNYLPSEETISSGLFNSWQSTVVDSFIVSENHPSNQKMLFEEILMLIVQSYTRLQLHFQIKQYAAHHLQSHESSAIGILMFSPFTKTYIEIGRISTCGDYISKRLWTIHKVSHNSSSFVSMIHVRVCNITRLLGLLVENKQDSSGRYEIPECLKSYMSEI